MKNFFFVLVLCCLLACGNSAQQKQEYMAIYERYNFGEIDTVMILLKEYTQKYPDNYNGWSFLGTVYFSKGNDSIAEIAFQKAIAIKPTVKQSLVGLGAINRMKGDLDMAEEFYHKALAVDRDFAEAYQGLSVIEIYRKNYDQAIEYGKKALALNDQKGMIAANLAIAYHCKKDTLLRNQYFQEAIKKGITEEDFQSVTLIFNGVIPIERFLNPLHEND